MTDYRADLAAIFPERYQKHLRLYELEAGEVICHQGDKLGALCYILEGQIKVVRRLYNGREHILDTKTAPALIGEIELLTQQKNVSSVVTLTKVTIAKLPLATLRMTS
nr:cyclic nucleotide-binding domain-containing protein [Streptococcus hyointestinalis]